MVRKAGLWVGNGNPQEKELMFSWEPDTVMVIYDYISANGVAEYKRTHPTVQVIVMFMHPLNWLDDVEVSARNTANELVGKWRNDAVLRALDPLVVSMNEPNLHYECGDDDVGNQWMYETKQHYQAIAEWFTIFAEIVKREVPAMRLLPPPMAYGHNEDGEPDDAGAPKLGWAGYDYLAPAIRQFCDGNLAAHFYWGYSGGSVAEWLYPEQEGTWHAFRWQRVLKLFETRYGWVPTIWIDECGQFSPQDADFTAQCEFYARHTLSHPNIGGLCFFLWDDPTRSAGNEINSWVAKVRDLAAHVSRMKNLSVAVDEQPGDGIMWFEDFTARALAHYAETGEALNEAQDYGVTIEVVSPDTREKLQCLGVYHLAGRENNGNHNFYFDGLDAKGARLDGYLLEITDASGTKTYPEVEKPANEPGGNIPLFKDQVVSGKVLSVANEYPSDVVRGVTTAHPDEAAGNTWHHHSFFAVWQIVLVRAVTPPGEPPITPPMSGGWVCKLLKLLCEAFCGE